MNVLNVSPKSALAFFTSTCLALGLGACSSSTNTASSDKLQVSTSFYPVLYLAQAIGADHVQATSLTPTNIEPHDFELSPKDITSLSDSALVFYVKGFQPSLDDAVTEVTGPTIVDLSSDVDLEVHDGVEDHDEDQEAEAAHGHDKELSVDPHFWLDPQRMQSAAKAVEAALAKADPQNAADYETNLASLTDKLNGIDADYTAGLATCERKTFVTSHAAFGYLADRYGLTQVSVSGLDPDMEPSPAELAKVTSVIKETGTTTVFTEELVSPTVSDTLAKETGATTKVLYTLEAQPDSGDYASAMESNLSSLETALGCQ